MYVCFFSYPFIYVCSSLRKYLILLSLAYISLITVFTIYVLSIHHRSLFFFLPLSCFASYRDLFLHFLTYTYFFLLLMFVLFIFFVYFFFINNLYFLFTFLFNLSSPLPSILFVINHSFSCLFVFIYLFTNLFHCGFFSFYFSLSVLCPFLFHDFFFFDILQHSQRRFSALCPIVYVQMCIAVSG